MPGAASKKVSKTTVSGRGTGAHGAAGVIQPIAASSLTPGDLPPVGDPRRWPLLQALRRQPQLEVSPWLAAIGSGELALEVDLVTVLAGHLDGEAAGRLLECWLIQQPRDRNIPALLGQRRDPVWAQWLRRSLAEAEPDARTLLLPLLGFQRDPADFAQLRDGLLDPAPLDLRYAALEALSVGLSAWPLSPLRSALAIVARDLQPGLAAASLDLLARLPGARVDLLRLARHHLDPSLETRLRRRLRSLPVAPLLLLVHGRSGGDIPEELHALAAELEQRRGATVQLRALTDPRPPGLPAADPLAPALTLVPLLLLPGSHVRQDLPRLAAELRRERPLRRLPFLGSWPVWQCALAAELRNMEVSAQAAQPPLLLHHPLQGPLAARFLSVLARRCGAHCLPAVFEDAMELPSLPAGNAASNPAVLPFALAANRLTESLQALAPSVDSRPLLQRSRLRQVLLETLLALP